MSGNLHAAAIVTVISLCTILLRFLPFGIFSGKNLPKSLLYMGKVLPGASLGMLVVYCLRDLSFSSPGCFLPELIAVGATALLQLRRRNTIISIIGGTAVYMILIRII